MKRFKLLGLVSIIVAIVGLLLPGCGTETETGTLDIGIATPLTGPAGSVGTNVSRAVQMAIDDQNASGGVTIGGTTYLLNSVVRDTKLDPATAKTIAEEMVYNDGIKIIFGPTPNEGPTMQAITDENKVLLFLMSVLTTSPEQPYCFSTGAIPSNMYATLFDYAMEYYPEAQSVVSFTPNTADAELVLSTAEQICEYYGYDYLGSEKWPYPDTTDFAPFAQRLMEYDADILDLAGSAATGGALAATIVKQIREAGFEGLILCPTSPPPDVMTTVPEQYLYKIVTNEINIDGSVVTDGYRDLCNSYIENYDEVPVDVFAQTYNVASALFQFLDGQETMDTEQWMEGFADYKWESSVYGEESQWVGEPLYGINRAVLCDFWASEWKNGELETNFVATLPLELWLSD